MKVVVSLTPKYTTYTSDGAGRDAYINYNNGGFLKHGLKMYGTNMTFKNQPRSTTNISARNCAPFTYYSDGTGRDSYILSHSGGLVRDYRSLKQFHLKDFLR
jgi:hypothetical protein